MDSANSIPENNSIENNLKILAAGPTNENRVHNKIIEKINVSLNNAYGQTQVTSTTWSQKRKRATRIYKTEMVNEQHVIK